MVPTWNSENHASSAFTHCQATTIYYKLIGWFSKIEPSLPPHLLDQSSWIYFHEITLKIEARQCISSRVVCTKSMRSSNHKGIVSSYQRQVTKENHDVWIP